MYQNKTTLGVITARGGSKGIPGKNIKMLCRKPLIAYTLESVQRSNYLTSCIVSTDDARIAEVSRKYGGEVPFIRPSELAQDTSGSVEVIQHALLWFKENEERIFDYVMILQPTSPFRTTEDIDMCIKKIVDTNADSVMSMVELTDFSLKKLKKIENDFIIPLIEDEGKISTRRNDLEKVYKRNCAIYLTRADLIMRGDLFGKISRPYVMPRERSIDINEPFDFEIAEFLMSRLL